ncbi:MAG TPA: hypothetical protein VIP27_10780 [Variovorax sp.]
MTAQKLLADAAALGITLRLDGEKVSYDGPREAVTADLLDRLRKHKAELRALLEAEAGHAPRQPDTAKAPAGEARSTPNSGRTGQVIYATFGRGYRHADGSIATGEPDPMPRPTVPRPTDLSPLLRRVSIARRWSDVEREHFVQWARRSQQGIDDARATLEAEAADLPKPGMAERRREVLAMLAADPDLRVAWTCDDSAEADPVVLTLAVRGAGTCELAIPRDRFSALELPMLIAKGTAAAQEAAP